MLHYVILVCAIAYSIFAIRELISVPRMGLVAYRILLAYLQSLRLKNSGRYRKEGRNPSLPTRNS